MKAYLESLRRLARIGMILLIFCVVGSAIYAARLQYRLPSMQDMFLPLGVYTFLGGAALAYTGFSFLNKRSDSDFYHSLPISRKGLFLSITLAALTWVAATVLVSVIAVTGMMLITRSLFVPLYPLLAVPFFIVATMLVFAAAAIACSLTGTPLTALALTLLVLFLPRFMQFVFARGIVAGVRIVSWLDLPWYLNPCYNIATGQIVLFSRVVYGSTFFTTPRYVLYSAALACIELAIGGCLFVRRPSELAERGARSTALQTVFACLSALPLTTLFAAGVLHLDWRSVLVVLAASLACYAIYQVVALRNLRKVLVSLPWYLASAALAVALFFGVQSAIQATLHDIPSLDEIAYVQVSGTDRGQDVVSYSTLALAEARLESEELKQYVVETLSENARMIDRYGYYRLDDTAGAPSDEASYTATQSVTIVLKNGRRIGRVLTFLNRNKLMALCEENAEYMKAIRTLPPTDSICYRQGYSAYDERFARGERIMQAYYDEIVAYNLVPYSQFRQYRVGDGYPVNEKQSYGEISMEGYAGTRRYSDYFTIRLETPKAASAWMAVNNDNSKGEYIDLLQQVYAMADHFNADNDTLNCDFTLYNVPVTDSVSGAWSAYALPSDEGAKYTRSIYANWSHYYGEMNDSDKELYQAQQRLVGELIGILPRSIPTSDPNAFCIYTQWSGRATDANGRHIGEGVISFASDGDAMVTYTSGGDIGYASPDYTILGFNPKYRSFTPEDEKRVIEIVNEYIETLGKHQYGYSYSG